MTTESAWIDEILGIVPTSSQKNIPKEDSKPTPQKEVPKLEYLLKLPLSNKISKQIIDILVTPDYEILVKTVKYGWIRSNIVYQRAYTEIQMDWEKTKSEIVEKMKDAIKTSEVESLIGLILDGIEKEFNKISYYLDGTITRGLLNYVSDYLIPIKDYDLSDTYDIYDNTEIETIDVSNAIKQSEGYHKVKGAIISMSEPFKLIQGYQAECNCGLNTVTEQYEVPRYREPRFNLTPCNKCQSSLNVHYEYVNAIMIELQDDEKFSDIERINCLLLDTDASNIKVGEKVTLSGSIHIIQKNQKGNLIPVLFCRNTLDYQNKVEVIISKLDEEAIVRFARMHGESIIPKLVDMFDKSVIGQEIAKECLLLSLVSSGNDLNKPKSNWVGRNRTHTLLVGKPGLAKSSLLKKTAKLITNSRYESSQHSSGKSLTAIIEKENENHLLRLGPIPLAKNSICALNEIGTLAFEEQKYLLDVMEEGEFSINKHGIHSDIESPTVIVASTNLLKPTNNQELVNGNISLDQIPLTGPIKDRFDLIAVIAEDNSDDAILNYIDKKIELLSKPIPIYDLFLQKYIESARKIESKVDSSCNSRIKYYYAALKKSNPDFGSNRMLETIIRLCKDISKLKLKQTVDELDVNEAIEFYDKLISKYISSSSRVPIEPDKYAFEQCLKVLEDACNQVDSAIKFEDLLYEVCENDAIVRRYILDSTSTPFDRRRLKINENRKARQVKDLLVENPVVRIVQRKPLTLQIDWANMKF